jgi:purine-binding chemotaxis protein CheW
MQPVQSAAANTSDTRQYLTLTLAGQMFGIPVLLVHDVLRNPAVNTIPLAPVGVAGSLNLRGRIVTAIDVRRKLGLGGKPVQDHGAMCIVVEHEGEMYGLLVDDVSDVLTLDAQQLEKVPSTLDGTWRETCQGIYKLEGLLLLILDIGRFFAHDALAD